MSGVSFYLFYTYGTIIFQAHIEYRVIYLIAESNWILEAKMVIMIKRFSLKCNSLKNTAIDFNLFMSQDIFF